MKDYIVVSLLNLLLLLHTPPSTPSGSFLQGVSVAAIYMVVKQVILNQEDAKDRM